MQRLGIGLGKRVDSLSTGQRAQVALARREFLGALMEAAAESEVTVLLSSHPVTDMERVCDYLIVLSTARIQVLGEVERLLAVHKLLTGPRIERDEVPGVTAVVSAQHTDRQSTLFVRTDRPVLDPAWTVQDVTLEDLVLAYLAQPAASAFPGPRASGDPMHADQMEVRT
jgi:ABC-2 type transport system ATP-binding protein